MNRPPFSAGLCCSNEKRRAALLMREASERPSCLALSARQLFICLPRDSEVPHCHSERSEESVARACESAGVRARLRLFPVVLLVVPLRFELRPPLVLDGEDDDLPVLDHAA